MRAFVTRIIDRGFYNIEEVLYSFGFPDTKVRTSLFRGNQFPLTYPFPKRIDRNFQGYVGLLAYDLIVLADVDPEVFTVKEMRDVVAFVENGGGLLLIGGPHSFAHTGDEESRRLKRGTCDGTYEPWSAFLPVEFVRGTLARVNAPPEATGEHPITRAIPIEKLGTIRTMHPLVPKAGAQVVLRASGRPLLVAGQYGKGRVLVLNTFPEVYETTEGSFFTGDYYDDLMRQAVMWLLHWDPKVAIREFTPTPQQLLVGEAAEASLTLSDAARVRFTVRKDGQAHISEERAAKAGGEAVRFAFNTALGAESDGCYRARIEVVEEEGKAVAWRDWAIHVRQPTRLEIDIVSRKDVVAPGSRLELMLQVVAEGKEERKLSATARLVDFRGDTVATFGPYDMGSSPISVAYDVPNLAKGEYRIVGELSVRTEGKTIDTTEVSLSVVDPVDPLALEDFFAVISEVKEAKQDPVFSDKDIEARIDDIIAHGSNVVALGQGELQQYDWGKSCTWDKLLNHAERYAQAKGLPMVYNYEHLILTGWETDPEKCIRAPGYRQALERYLRPQLATGTKIPRLVSVEIYDEPRLSADDICYCQRCRTAFREKYGWEMPKYEEIVDCDSKLRLAFFEFHTDFWREVFRHTYEVKRESGVPFRINHTFCVLAFGLMSVARCFEDAFKWFPYCDVMDWDWYPYFYPIFRGAHQLRFGMTRYEFTGFRLLAEHFGKPWGFFVEIDDRNYPQYITPVRASRELTYTAIGQGADYIKTFVNLPFSDSMWCATKERWDDLGQELKKVHRYSPLLTRVERARAKIAMLFPLTHMLLHDYTRPTDVPPGFAPREERWFDRDLQPYDKYWPMGYLPFNGYELFYRAFGEIDLLHEKLVPEGYLEKYGVLVLLGVKYVPEDVTGRIAAFVEKGGAIVLDSIPGKDASGDPEKVLAQLFGGQATEETVLDGDLRATVRPYGKGVVLLFSQDLSKAYTDAVVCGDTVLRKRMEEFVRGFLFGRGLRPAALPTNGEFEADVLVGQDCFLLVAINHANKDDCSTITIYNPAIRPGYACDLATMEEVPFVEKEGAITLELALGERCGQVIGFYTEKPQGNRVAVEKETLKRGEDLSYRAEVVSGGGSPLAGSHVVEITVTDPEGVVRERYGGLHTTTDGVYVRRVPLAQNDAVGLWTIAVYDRYTRRKSTASFRVVP